METGFIVSPEIIDLLGNGYKAAEYAIRELVDNAWDADAQNVWITLPESLPIDLSQYELSVKDDGAGMGPRELASEYLHIANNRHTLRGDFTTDGRPVKGRKGIGKFSGLYIGTTVTVTTHACGRSSKFEFNREVLQQAAQANQALDRIKLNLVEDQCAVDEHGTTITVRGLRETLVQPSNERLKRLLVQEYGRAENFNIVINGEVLSLAGLPGQAFEYADNLPDVGAVRLHFIISLGKQPLRDAGIGLRVKSKSIGKPSFFDVRERIPELPKKLLRRVYGDVEADSLFDLITPHWDELPHDTRAYKALTEFVQAHLEVALRGAFQTELSIAKARLQKHLNKELQKLPEFKRDFARKAVEQALRKFYDLPSDKIEALVGFILNAIDRDDYYFVLKMLDEAKYSEVSMLAEALAEFGLVELTRTKQSLAARFSFLESLQQLADKAATTEQAMHEAIADNLWLLGPNHSSLISNQSLRSTVKRLTGQDKYTGKNATKRPDLLLNRDYQGRYLLIEFKRPSYTITNLDVAQAANYRQELLPYIESGARVDLLVIGGQQNVQAQYMPADHTRVETFNSLISAATSMLEWLSKELA